MSELVAKALSHKGGQCNHCHAAIRPLGVIYKVPRPGTTTVQGNGPGHWICPACAGNYDDPRGIYETPLFG